jgi:hypothetical protein
VKDVIGAGIQSRIHVMEDDRESLSGWRSACPGDLGRNGSAAGILRRHHGAIFISVHGDDELWRDSTTAATTTALSATTAAGASTAAGPCTGTLSGALSAAGRRALRYHGAHHNG